MAGMQQLLQVGGESEEREGQCGHRGVAMADRPAEAHGSLLGTPRWWGPWAGALGRLGRPGPVRSLKEKVADLLSSHRAARRDQEGSGGEREQEKSLHRSPAATEWRGRDRRGSVERGEMRRGGAGMMEVLMARLSQLMRPLCRGGGRRSTGWDD